MAAAIAAVASFASKYSSIISLVGSAVSAVSSYQQGQMQAMQYRLQASQAELQGRQNALNYNRQGLQALRRQQQLAATVRARGFAGGVDAFTGSPLTIQQVDMIRAQEEAALARDNAQLAIYGGLAQSQSLQAAASGAQRTGTLSALGSLASGAVSYSDLRAPVSPNMSIPVRDAVPMAVG